MEKEWLSQIFFFKVSSEPFPFLIAKAHSGHLSYGAGKAMCMCRLKDNWDFLARHVKLRDGQPALRGHQYLLPHFGVGCKLQFGQRMGKTPCLIFLIPFFFFYDQQMVIFYSSSELEFWYNSIVPIKSNHNISDKAVYFHHSISKWSDNGMGNIMMTEWGICIIYYQDLRCLSSFFLRE